MRPSSVLLAVCLAGFTSASIDDSRLLDVADKAIYAAAASASTVTSFVMEHTRITITKYENASSLAHSHAGRRHARIVVTDAAAKGLVCLPRGSVKESAAATEESEVERVATGGGEATKADITTVGQGEGITASVSSSAAASAGAGSSAAAASGAGASAAASSGAGASAAAAAGAGSSAAASSGSGSAAAASSSDSSAASTSGHAAAAADSHHASDESHHASADSHHASADSTHGGADVDASGEHAYAAASDDHGHVITTGSSGERLVVDESDCECVPSYLCDEEGYINTFGSDIIDIRSFSATKQERTHYSKCKADETCCRHRHGEDRVPIGWLPSGCGKRAPIRLDRRIVGGEASRIGKNPWMVALLKRTSDGHDVYLCGGSLIALDVVLTGSHCVKAHKDDHLVVRVGEWDTSSTDHVYPHHDIDVSQVVTHEKFNGKTLFNDVALLKLSEPAEIQPHVNEICLPTADHHDIDFEHCVATGWGKDSFENGVYASILKEVPLKRVDHDHCQHSLRTTRLGRWFRLHNSFTCAGGEHGVDTCKGDGGSPLVCRLAHPASVEDETYVQVGIVAWGIGCGKAGIPGVYADVQKLLPWIQEHLAELTTVEAYP